MHFTKGTANSTATFCVNLLNYKQNFLPKICTVNSHFWATPTVGWVEIQPLKDQ